MRSLRRLSLVVALTLLAACAAAGAAHGAIVIGSDLATEPTIGLAVDGVGTQIAPRSGASLSVVSPSSGVLTRIRLRYGSTDEDSGIVAFRILSGTNPFDARPATADGAELQFPLPANVPAGGGGFLDYVPTDAAGTPVGIPIAAGERLGLAQESTGMADVVAELPGDPATVAFFGGSQHLSGLLQYREESGYELALQGVVEPDVDRDRRGDETQDPGVTRRAAAPARRACRVPLLRRLTRRLARRLLLASGCQLGRVTTRVVRRGVRGRVVFQSRSVHAVLPFRAKVDVKLAKRVAARHRRRRAARRG